MSTQDSLIDAIIDSTRLWQGIEMPHASARDFAADLLGTIRAFEHLPPVDFNARSCDFMVALQELADEQ